MRMVGLQGIPDVATGDNIARLIVEAAATDTAWADCVAVVAQKIVSRSEGRVVDLNRVQPSEQAREYAAKQGKDPRLMEVILGETRRIVKMERDVMIVETRHGLVCANAGVDQSNAPGPDLVTLLPADPDASAERIRAGLREKTGHDVPVIISDTFGRPWRMGLVNVAIGAAGLAPLKDYRGRRDRAGRLLRGTVSAVADELAAAAGLMMEKASGAPVVLIHGAAIERGAGSGKDLIRPPEEDLFR